MIIDSSILEHFEHDSPIKEIQISDLEVKKHSTIMKIMTHLKQQYHEHSFKVTELASLSAMSERQLFRFFKNYLSMSPSNFIQQYRIEKSVQSLKQSRTLGDISFDVGFSSQSYFCRCFKQLIGLSPSKFKI